ncbi:phage late control D family protein [Roseovarius sp. SYSU LYC5161]|uniref:phage late control D family protein n=1 Tax=Roseovarius halophilus (ex Wu et al. 2025) TaxID=3376060 RepID=UPI00399A8F0C
MSKRAVFNVTVAGTNITTALIPVLLGLRVSDKVGTHTDSADLEIDDADGRIVLPRKGAKVEVGLGWSSEGMRTVFRGTVDEVKSSGNRGAGRRLMITAKGMDTTGPVKEGQQRHWDDVTVDTILRDAAGFAGIANIEIDPGLRGLTRTYFEMRDESFIAMGERLAREIGGNFRIVGDTVILSKRNADYQAAVRAVWGENLHSWDITPQLGRPQFSEVRARWYDVARAGWQLVQRSTGLDVQAIHAARLSRAGATEASQQADSDAATAEHDAGEGTVTIEGNTGAVPDGLCVVAGTRTGLDGAYRIEAVTHTLTRGGGFVTSLDLKQPQDGAGRDAREAKTDPVSENTAAQAPLAIEPDATGPF